MTFKIICIFKSGKSFFEEIILNGIIELGKFNDNVINKIYNKGLEIDIKMTGLALVGVRDLAGVRAPDRSLGPGRGPGRGPGHARTMSK